MLSAEQLKIDTPEQIALELPVAGVGSRFLAIAVDTLLQLGLYLLAAIGLMLLGPGLAGLFDVSAGWASVGPAVMVLAIFCVYWGYFSFFEILWKGQTPGKRAADIRVIKMSGRPLDGASAVIRNLLRVVDFLPALYGFGVACMLLNRHSRRIGDFVAGTVVVHDHPARDLQTAWSPPAVSHQVRLAVAPLANEEVVLIETYLARRLDLAGDVRAHTAAQILRRITDRTGLTPDPGQPVDDFLERVARDARDASRFR